MNTPIQPTTKFPLGRVCATPNALDAVPNEEMLRALQRHHSGDWGDVDAEDHAANEQALREDTRLFSMYLTQAKIKFWIITEADRSLTTILLPEDY